MLRTFIGLLLGCWLLLHGGMAVAMAYCPQYLPDSGCHEPLDSMGCDHCVYCLGAQAPALPVTWVMTVLKVPPQFIIVNLPVYRSQPTKPRYHPPCA